MQQLKDFYSLFHQATKPLIKAYRITKKKLIYLALKIFFNNSKANMFFSLEKENDYNGWFSLMKRNTILKTEAKNTFVLLFDCFFSTRQNKNTICPPLISNLISLFFIPMDIKNLQASQRQNQWDTEQVILFPPMDDFW